MDVGNIYDKEVSQKKPGKLSFGALVDAIDRTRPNKQLFEPNKLMPMPW